MGMPDIWHPDAHQYVGAAWLMGPGELNPRDWLIVHTNSHLYYYMLMATKGVLALWFAVSPGAGDLKTFVDAGGLALAARAMGGVMGALSVIVAYRIAALMLGRPVGMAAAALLATNFFNVRNAHFAMPDVAMMFFLLCTVERSAVYWRTGRSRHLIAAAILAGVTTSTKITGGVAALCPLAALLLRRRTVDWVVAAKWTGAVVAVAVVSFFALSPYMALDPRCFREIAHEVLGEGAARGEVQGPAPAWLLHHRHYVVGMGWAAYALAAIGVALMIRRKPRVAGMLLVAPGVYLAVHLMRSLCYMRYTLPPVPFWLLAAAWAAWRIGRRFRARRLATLCIVALACTGPLARSVRFDWIVSQEDTRSLARRWIQERVPRHAVILTEGLFPAVPTHPYCIYAHGSTGIFSTFVRPEYFVSDMSVRQYLGFHKAYGQGSRALYDSIESTNKVVAEFKPYRGDAPLPYHATQVNAPAIGLWRTTRPGPHIKIYLIDANRPKSAASIVMLNRPFDRRDWHYIAAISNFPMAMLTRAWDGTWDTVKIVREETARLKCD